VREGERETERGREREGRESIWVKRGYGVLHAQDKFGRDSLALLF